MLGGPYQVLGTSPSGFFKRGNFFVTLKIEKLTAPYLVDVIRDEVLMSALRLPMRARATSSAGDLPYLYARKDLPDDFKRKMLYDNPVRFYRFSEGESRGEEAKNN